jgi:3'-phosphoadenosine 5'-phosphosulfate synthase
MRILAKNKENLPNGFMCRGGWEVLVDYYDSLVPASNGKVPEAVPA